MFRVWAPFADAVAVKINGGSPLALAKEPGHADDDAVWAGSVAGTSLEINTATPFSALGKPASLPIPVHNNLRASMRAPLR